MSLSNNVQVLVDYASQIGFKGHSNIEQNKTTGRFELTSKKTDYKDLKALIDAIFNGAPTIHQSMQARAALHVIHSHLDKKMHHIFITKNEKAEIKQLVSDVKKLEGNLTEVKSEEEARLKFYSKAAPKLGIKEAAGKDLETIKIISQKFWDKFQNYPDYEKHMKMFFNGEHILFEEEDLYEELRSDKTGAYLRGSSHYDHGTLEGKTGGTVPTKDDVKKHLVENPQYEVSGHQVRALLFGRVKLAIDEKGNPIYGKTFEQAVEEAQAKGTPVPLKYKNCTFMQTEWAPDSSSFFSANFWKHRVFSFFLYAARKIFKYEKPNVGAYGYGHADKGFNEKSNPTFIRHDENLLGSFSKELGEEIKTDSLKNLAPIDSKDIIVKKENVEQILQEREEFVEKDIQSDSFKLQEMVFDAFSLDKDFKPQLTAVFSNSTPDRQIFSLVRDLHDFMKENITTLSEPQLEKLHKVIRKLQDAKRTALLISAIISTKTIEEKEALRKELAAELKKRVENLADGEKILIPAGYMNGNIYDMKGLLEGKVEGHTMLLEVQKRGDVFDARVFNTGIGRSLHTKDPKKKNNYFPLRYQNIPKDKLGTLFFDRLTAFSWNEGIVPHKITRVYALLKVLWGAPVKPNPKVEKSYRMQISQNNCTKKSLQVWMHDEMQDMEPIYKQFRNFRTKKKIVEARKITSKGLKELKYNLPLAMESEGKLDFASKMNRFLAAKPKQIPIATDIIRNLVKKSEGVLKRREKKAA